MAVPHGFVEPNLVFGVTRFAERLVEKGSPAVHGVDVVPAAIGFFFRRAQSIPGSILVLDPTKCGVARWPEPLHRIVLGQVINDLLAADGHDLVIDEALEHLLQPELVVSVSVAYGELTEFASGPFHAEVAGQAMVEGGAVNFYEVHLREFSENVEGAICGTTVYDNNFMDGHGLFQNALYALPDSLGFVANGNDDRYGGEGH